MSVFYALLIGVGGLGMFASGVCLAAVLLRRRSWWSFADDFIPSAGLIVAGVWGLVG